MATTNGLRRPPVEPPSRAALRKQRLIEMENEQRIEDAEALKFTEEQRLSLLHSFRHVKFEWSDLDGLRSMRRRYNSPPPRHVHSQCHPTSPVRSSVTHPTTANGGGGNGTAAVPTSAFAVLTNARLASFGANDTICVRNAAPLPPPSPTPTLTPASPLTSSFPAPAPTPAALRSTTRTSPSPKPKVVRTTTIAAKSSSRRRSPVKGLFPAPMTSTTPAATPRSPPGIPIRVPAPPLASVSVDTNDSVNERNRAVLAALLQDGPFADVDEEEDDGSWVDLEEDEYDIDDDDEEEEDEEEEEEFTYDGVDGRAAPLPPLPLGLNGDAYEQGEEDEEFDESALPTPVPGAAGGWRLLPLPQVAFELEWEELQ